jgi:hypothetical protein
LSQSVGGGNFQSGEPPTPRDSQASMAYSVPSQRGAMIRDFHPQMAQMPADEADAV